MSFYDLAGRVRTLPSARAAEVARRQLVRCRSIERDYGEELNEQGAQLLHRAAFAAYADLRDLGLGAEARALVQG